MSASQDFPLADVISVYHGVMVSTVPSAMEVLNFMTGCAVFDSAAESAAQACNPSIAVQFPAITQIDCTSLLQSIQQAKAGGSSKEDIDILIDDWLKQQVDTYGAQVPLVSLSRH